MDFLNTKNKNSSDSNEIKTNIKFYIQALKEKKKSNNILYTASGSNCDVTHWFVNCSLEASSHFDEHHLVFWNQK